jgi:hypothetical protein
MTAPKPEAPVTASEERIGKYRVHPVAAMFPLLSNDEYEELKGSIELLGQTYPIIVQGDILLDGRNRLKACLELEMEPKIQEYRGNQPPEFFIESANIYRRHLSEDARAGICAQIRTWIIAQQNAAVQKTGKSADGTAGGRGHKKAVTPPPTDRSSSAPQPGEETLLRNHSKVSEPQSHARNARSTVGQVADAAKVSHHKAAQAVAVAKAAPDLLEPVKTGKVKLKDAHAKVKAARSSQPASKPGLLDVETRLLHRIRQVMKSYPSAQGSLRRSILAAIGHDSEPDHKPAPRQEEPKHAKESFSIENVVLGFGLARDAAFSQCPAEEQVNLAIKLLERFWPVIDLLLRQDKWVIVNLPEKKGLIMDLDVNRLVELIRQELTAEQRAELRKKW